MWTSNPNQFVEDEDDDTFSFSVRIAAQDVLLVCNILSFSLVLKLFRLMVFLRISRMLKRERERPLLSCFAWNASMK